MKVKDNDFILLSIACSSLIALGMIGCLGITILIDQNRLIKEQQKLIHQIELSKPCK